VSPSGVGAPFAARLVDNGTSSCKPRIFSTTRTTTTTSLNSLLGPKLAHTVPAVAVPWATQSSSFDSPPCWPEKRLAIA
jgi:hypothetical protein